MPPPAEFLMIRVGWPQKGSDRGGDPAAVGLTAGGVLGGGAVGFGTRNFPGGSTRREKFWGYPHSVLVSFGYWEKGVLPLRFSSGGCPCYTTTLGAAPTSPDSDRPGEHACRTNQGPVAGERRLSRRLPARCQARIQPVGENRPAPQAGRRGDARRLTLTLRSDAPIPRPANDGPYHDRVRHSRRRAGFPRLAVRGGAQAGCALPGCAARQGPRPVRDRLRPLGPAAYRHLRRGRAHDHGAPRLRNDLRHSDAPDRLLGRHGRHAQGAGQRARPGDAARAPAKAADQRARPVRRVRELRRPQQRDAAALPRPFRLRVRVRLGHRLLPLGQAGRGAAPRHRAL